MAATQHPRLPQMVDRLGEFSMTGTIRAAARMPVDSAYCEGTQQSPAIDALQLAHDPEADTAATDVAVCALPVGRTHLVGRTAP